MTDTIRSDLVQTVPNAEPQPDLAARYEGRYQRCRKIYPALKPVYPEIH